MNLSLLYSGGMDFGTPIIGPLIKGLQNELCSMLKTRDRVNPPVKQAQQGYGGADMPRSNSIYDLVAASELPAA